MRRGGRFRADWLRSTSPLPPTSFPAPSLETNSLAGPSLLYLPWRQVVPPPQLHHLSTEFPAHCPKNIPPSSAQIGIRIQWRYPTMLSGGERRWLRCSFECLIYFFILLIVILLHSLFNQILIIYWNEKVFFSLTDLLPRWKQICFDSCHKPPRFLIRGRCQNVVL